MIRRENPDSRVRKRANDGYIQAYSMFEQEPETSSTSWRPVADDLVGEGDVTVPGVPHPASSVDRTLCATRLR